MAILLIINVLQFAKINVSLRSFCAKSILMNKLVYMKKEEVVYLSPEIKIIQFDSEGFLCISGYVEDSEDVELF